MGRGGDGTGMGLVDAVERTQRGEMYKEDKTIGQNRVQCSRKW